MKLNLDFLKDGKAIIYIAVIAVVVYAIYTLKGMTKNLTDALKKIAPWAAGIAAVIAVVMIVTKKKDKNEA